jgi:glycosidase
MRHPLRPQPGHPLSLFATTAGPKPFEQLICRYRIGSLPPVEAPFEKIGVDFDDLLWDYVSRWRTDLPALPEGTLLWYQVAGRIAASSRWIYADNQATIAKEGTLFAASFDHFVPPAWSRSAMVYHVFVDRFYPGDGVPWKSPGSASGFYGGTLEGVRHKLDYIQGLGFNTIWLSPVFESPSHHGYDSTDLFTVAAHFGGGPSLEALIANAHSRGMRVLLDFVPNHWSDRHPTFLHARSHADSPFRDWYLWRHWPDDYECYYEVHSMPKLNLSPGSPARAHLIDAAQYWLRAGVDGFRLDHVEGPVSNFWIDFRRACLQANPECWLFGEVVRPPSRLHAYAYDLHGSLDFALARALRQTIGLERWSLSQLESFLRAHEGFFDAGFSRPAFLDNHDMNRFVYLSGGNRKRLKLGALILYSLPAQPVLYYGTETGLSQKLDIADGAGLDEARLPMRWESEQDEGLLAYFRRLGRLRAAFPLPENAERRLLLLDQTQGLYAFLWQAGKPLFLAAFNFSSEQRTAAIANPFDQLPHDALSGQPVKSRDGALEINLAPQSGSWIAP